MRASSTTEPSAPGLYVHVPFCATVCPYCDFAVLVGDAPRRDRFMAALLAEVRLRGNSGIREIRGLDTIYFGGGTPSLLEPEQIARTLSAIEAGLSPARGARVYLEANPEDVTSERLQAWRELGVGTLSLGVQSFDPTELEFLGRLHGPDQARRSVESALAAGFGTVSMDLIYGLPGQTRGGWLRQLETAVEIGPDHLSCYELTVHRRTAFGVRRERGELVEIPDEDQAELFLLTHRFLNDHGYVGYEVSNFARSAGHRSRHNQKYWNHTPYLGLGPSAHSYAGRRRWWNHRGLGAWQQAVEKGEMPVGGGEELGREELALEFLMLGLRTLEGVDLGELEARYGMALIEGGARLARFVERGLVTVEGGRLRPSLRGLVVAETLARDLEIERACQPARAAESGHERPEDRQRDQDDRETDERAR